MMFTNFDTTFNSTLYNGYTKSPDGTSVNYGNAPSLNLFHAVIKVTKSQLDELTLDQLKRISITNATKQLKTRANGKKFTRRTADFYQLIDKEDQ